MRFRVAESKPKPPASSSSSSSAQPSTSSRPQPVPSDASQHQGQPERPHPPSLSVQSAQAQAKRDEDVPADARTTVSRESLKTAFNLGLSTPAETVNTSVHTEVPLVPPPGDVDQKSDSGNSISTEAYNSEDEHGASAAEVATAAAEVAGGLPTTRHLNTEEKEALFRHQLASRAWRISEVRADGNCLFRALAYAAWGDEEQHGTLRARVMDYIVEERDYFSQFIAEDFQRYVRRKRRDGTHGNHPEMQAAADLFGSRIEVYAYNLVPFTVMTPSVGGTHGPLLKLSFHRGSHYNALVGATPKKLCPKKLAVAAAESTRRRNLQRALENSSSSRSEEARIDALADTLATEEELEQAALELSIRESHQARLRTIGASSGAGSAGQASSSSSGRYNSNPHIPDPFQDGLASNSISTAGPPNMRKAGPSAGSSSAAGPSRPSHAWKDSEDEESR